MIVVIDNYDSFVYGLVDCLGKIVDLPVRVFRSDAIRVEQLRDLRPEYIVISSGPKAPEYTATSRAIIREYGTHVPVLGVGLGHQAVGEEFGGEIVQAKKFYYGNTCQVSHCGDRLFHGISNPFEACRYGSLVVDAARSADDLEPIAFSVRDSEIMGLKHRDYDIYGVQFHPESVCTPTGMKLLENFLELGKRGNDRR